MVEPTTPTMPVDPAAPEQAQWPRPVEDSYWIVPGRLLIGGHPGSRSRAQSMERVRCFLDAGITNFIDLTEAHEAARYEVLLPYETPTGQRIEYLREPIADHDVPASREDMGRVLAAINLALDNGRNVYVHCRAGIGRSAMVAGCWLAERHGGGAKALAELAELWQQTANSRLWTRVPETDSQAAFVHDWKRMKRAGRRSSRKAVALDAASGPIPEPRLAAAQRIRGAWFGLALGDAHGAAHAFGQSAAPNVWTQHTALALCLADSLLEHGRCDARDQVERYLRWQHDGLHSATSEPGEASVTPDVAKALATYRWRGLPMAGSHNPADLSPTSLPRVIAPALYAAAEPLTAVALAAECSRTTHQSPTILDACRLLAAMIVCGLQERPASTWLGAGPCDTEPSCWQARPLRPEVTAVASDDGKPIPHRTTPPPPASGTVLHALMHARRAALQAVDFDAALTAACRAGRQESALYAALAGMLFGLLHGIDALPQSKCASLASGAQVEDVARRFIAHAGPAAGVA